MMPSGLPALPHGAVLVDLQEHLGGGLTSRLARRLTGLYGGRLGVLASLGGLRAWVDLVAGPGGLVAAVTGWDTTPITREQAERLAIATARGVAPT